MVNGGCAPLSKIDGTTAIRIGLVEDLVGALFDLRRITVLVEFLVGLEELVALDQPITVLIELVEALAEFVLLLLGGQVARHESQSRLLQLALILNKIIRGTGII